MFGAFSALSEGLRLRRFSLRENRRDVALGLVDAPETPMVSAARAYVEARACRSMLNHAHRTAFWTLVVRYPSTRRRLAPEEAETAWVAARSSTTSASTILRRAATFTLGGVLALEKLALEIGWSDEQTHVASEAIVTNLSTHVDAARSGRIAWAMNVGGLAEVGFGPHRAQWDPRRIEELEIFATRARASAATRCASSARRRSSNPPTAASP